MGQVPTLRGADVSSPSTRSARANSTAPIVFANPPANLVVPETVVSLHKIIAGFENDPDIRPGAQPVEVIGNALRQAWAEAHPTKTFAAAADADGHCDDCKLPS